MVALEQYFTKGLLIILEKYVSQQSVERERERKKEWDRF